MRHSTPFREAWSATAYGQQRLLSSGGGPDGSEPDRTDLKILRVQPGKATSHHFHLLRKSWFYILSGSLEVTCRFDDWSVVVTTGDFLELEPGEDHSFFNRGDSDALVLEVGSPGHMPEDKISFSAKDRICSVSAGRYWDERKDRSLKIKIGGVESLDAACLCHELGVDALGLELDHCHWSRSLARMEWARRLPRGMSLFLVTHLTQPTLVTAMLHRLGCDTLQWRGNGEIPSRLPDLYRKVRQHGFRVVHTLRGTHASVLREVREIGSWVDLFDALVWQPANRGDMETGAAEQEVILALATLAKPWLLACDHGLDAMSGFVETPCFSGYDILGSGWRSFCGQSEMLVADREKIQRMIPHVHALEKQVRTP
ncbi:MAG: cupin domain-containing protein [Magnetococcales bacterium]|nr:cupin domain-containing protein [Magnetococcales bacterium]